MPLVPFIPMQPLEQDFGRHKTPKQIAIIHCPGCNKSDFHSSGSIGRSESNQVWLKLICASCKDVLDVEIVSMFDKPKEEVDSLTEKINRIYFGT